MSKSDYTRRAQQLVSELLNTPRARSIVEAEIRAAERAARYPEPRRTAEEAQFAKVAAWTKANVQQAQAPAQATAAVTSISHEQSPPPPGTPAAPARVESATQDVHSAPAASPGTPAPHSPDEEPTPPAE